MKSRIVRLLLLALFIGIFTNMAHPVTPAHFRQIGVSDDMFGYAFSSMSLGVLVFAPIWGSLGDAYKRQTMILLSLLGYGVGQALFAYALSDPFILFARFLAGASIAGLSVNVLANLSEEPEFIDYRKRFVSTYVSFNVIGGALGYFIGGQLGDRFTHQYNIVIYLQAFLTLFILIYAKYGVTMRDLTVEVSKRRGVVKQLLAAKDLEFSLFFFLLIGTFVSFAHTNINKFIEVYVTDQGLRTSDLGNMVLVTVIITLLTNLFITPYVMKRYSLVKGIVFSLILGAVFVFFTFRVPNLLVGLYTLYMVFIISRSMFDPLVVSYLSENPKHSPGILLGIRQSMISIGMVIAPLVGSQLYKQSGQWLFDVQAMVLVLSALLYLTYVIIKKKEERHG